MSTCKPVKPALSAPVVVAPVVHPIQPSVLPALVAWRMAAERRYLAQHRSLPKKVRK
jgi:hypothetical protein